MRSLQAAIAQREAITPELLAAIDHRAGGSEPMGRAVAWGGHRELARAFPHAHPAGVVPGL